MFFLQSTLQIMRRKSNLLYFLILLKRNDEGDLNALGIIKKPHSCQYQEFFQTIEIQEVNDIIFHNTRNHILQKFYLNPLLISA